MQFSTFAVFACSSFVVSVISIPFAFNFLADGGSFTHGSTSRAPDHIATVQAASNQAASIEQAATTTVMAGPVKLQPVATTTLKSGTVELQYTSDVLVEEAQAVLKVLASPLGYGDTRSPHAFRLQRDKGVVQMEVHPPMARKHCEAFQPIFEIFATIISHSCFDQQAFEVIQLPSDASKAIRSVNRSDVKACWFGGKQSIFLDRVLTPEQLEAMAAKLRAVGLVGPVAEPGNFFIRAVDSKTQVNMVGMARQVEAADPKQLAVTVRDKALMWSLSLAGGGDCKFRLTDARFEKELVSFELTPPCQATYTARSGCYLFISDGSVPQSTLDAIAKRQPPVLGQDVTIDVWLQQVGSDVVAKWPFLDAEYATSETARQLLYATGMNITSELPVGTDLQVHACDEQFLSQSDLTVTQRYGAYVARGNNRLMYASTFDETFVNQLADYLVHSSFFTANTSIVLKLDRLSDEDATPQLQIVMVLAHEPHTDIVELMHAFGRIIATSQFSETGLVYEICDAYGDVIGPLRWRFSPPTI